MSRLACDDVECALAVRADDPFYGIGEVPTFGGVFGVRIALDTKSAQPAVRITTETNGPPPVAMRTGGVSLVIYNDVQRTTLRAVRLDSAGVKTPLVTRPLPLSLVAADRSGLYWTETLSTGSALLHWSEISAHGDPAMLTTLDLGDAMPAPIAASSTGVFAHVAFTAGTTDPALLAPRIFVRTFATPDPRPAAPPPPRHRAAGH